MFTGPYLHITRGPIIGPIPNPKYPPFFPKSKEKNSQSEYQNINLTGEGIQLKIATELLSEPRCNFDLDGVSAWMFSFSLCAFYTEMSSVFAFETSEIVPKIFNLTTK